MTASEHPAGGRPEVSVVIPTRNRWPHLQRALRSVLMQEEVQLEAIVVDDGSTDETPAMLDGMSDPRVRLIRRDPPHGPALARNAGVDAARGEWLAFLDDDDLWAPRKLRTQLDAAHAAGAGFAYSGSFHLDKTRENVVFVQLPPEPAGLERSLLIHNVIPGGCSNAIVRRDVVEKVGSFDERLAELADWDLWVRVVAETEAAATPDLFVAYLEHDQNMLFRDKPRVSREVDYLDRKHADARRAHGVKLDRRFFRQWVGYQYRRAARTHRDEGRRLTAVRYFIRAGVLSENPIDLARAGAALIGKRAQGPARRARRALARLLRRTETHGVPSDVGPAGPAWLDAYR